MTEPIVDAPAPTDDVEVLHITNVEGEPTAPPPEPTEVPQNPLHPEERYSDDYVNL